MSDSAAERLRRFEWLVEHGYRWLEGSNDGVVTTGATAWQRELLAEQRFLRERSKPRFPQPERWLWTDRGLAQASDWWSASFKASLVPTGASVVDACCGAGADLVALAQRGTVEGVDRDPVAICLANANLKSHGLQASAKLASFPPLGLSPSHWLHVDPDRRAANRRTCSAEDFCPPVSEILGVASSAAGTVIKVAPKTSFTDELAVELAHRSIRLWIGNRGEARQQLILLGGAREQLMERFSAPRIKVGAALVEPERRADSLAPVVQFFGEAAEPASVTNVADDFVYDLHRVLHAAELQMDWAGTHGLAAIGSRDGFFTGPQPIDSPWVQTFKVLDLVSWDDRKVRRALKRLGAGPVEVKNRVHRMDANHFQRRYATSAGRPIAILVSRIGERVRAILAERL